MNGAIRTAGLVTAALVITTSSAAPAAAGPVSTEPLRAKGHFSTEIDQSSVRLKEMPGNRCEFSVKAKVTFTGTLSGEARGKTTAIIFSPCVKAGSNPPGTFRDTFRFRGKFSGAIGGKPTTGSLKYSGVTAPGGDIRAAVHFDGDDGWAHLRADGNIARGNDYSGAVKVS